MEKTWLDIFASMKLNLNIQKNGGGIINLNLDSLYPSWNIEI